MGRKANPEKVHEFRLEEMETIFTIDATDRSIARVYSNDPVFIRKIERAGAEVVEKTIDGGMFFNLPISQLTIRKPPRRLSTEEKTSAVARLAIARKKA
jgi:hypothetical protein